MVSFTPWRRIFLSSLPCPWDLPGYSHVLSHLYLPRLLLAFRAVIGLWFVQQPHPRFAAYPDNFYRPVVCLRLPSDPTSRWRPCHWLHPSHCRAGQGRVKWWRDFLVSITCHLKPCMRFSLTRLSDSLLAVFKGYNCIFFCLEYRKIQCRSSNTIS